MCSNTQPLQCLVQTSVVEPQGETQVTGRPEGPAGSHEQAVLVSKLVGELVHPGQATAANSPGDIGQEIERTLGSGASDVG